MSRLKSTLWVCPTPEAAVERADTSLPKGRKRRLVSNDHRLKVMIPGEAICGYGFDEIIFDGFDPYESTGSDVEDRRMRSWVRNSLYCRLYPGGQMKMLIKFEAQL